MKPRLKDLLKRALDDLKEYKAEYHHRGQPGLIEEIEAVLKDPSTVLDYEDTERDKNENI
jgi:hypothetical protein